MIRAGSLTPTALGWVRSDLDRELERARAQMQAIAENPATGGVVIEGAMERLDELGRIFETLVLDGARQVTMEMRRLLESLGDSQEGQRDVIGGALLEAVLVLPAYLDRVQSGQPDLPMLLLPVINQLREAGGEAPLSEGQVFAPLLDVELPELDAVQKAGFDEPFERLTGRLQAQYDTALQNWLQDPSDPSLLSPMQGICETLRHRMERYDLKRLWWVATEVFGGLLEGHVANDLSLRRLLARLSRLMLLMSEEGEDGIDDRTSTSITQSLLFHIGNAEPGCEGVDLVRSRFELDRHAPDESTLDRARGMLSGADRETYTSLSAAVEDELATVKDALDLELRTGQADEALRRQCAEALRRLTDTLSMLGLSAAGERIAGLLPAFEDSAGDAADERGRILEALAEQLLLVESALRERVETLGESRDGEDGEADSHIALSAHERRRILSTLMDECVTSVRVSQDAVRERFAGKAAGDPGEPLGLVAGALRMANETATAELTERLADTLERYLGRARDGLEIGREDMETLADAMAGLELFLSASRDRQRDAAHFADLVAERLDRIERKLSAGDGGDDATVGAAAASRLQAVPAPAPEPVAPTPADASPTDEVERGATTSDADTGPARAPVTGQPPAPAPAPAAPAPAAAASGDMTDDDDSDELPTEIDPELREIFLEEYEEVLQALQASVPVWVDQLDNAEALTEIRRAFHTLKGSGRMVGADELGDFAWQIENMLNALLEGRTDNFGDASVMVRLAEASLPALRQRLLQENAGLTRGLIVAIGDTAEVVSRRENADWGSLQPRLPVYLAGLLPSDVRPAPSAAPRSDSAPGAADSDSARIRATLEQRLVPLRAFMDAVAQDRETRASDEQVRAASELAATLESAPEGLDAPIARALAALLEAQSRSGRPYTPDVVFTVISAVGQMQNRLERLEGHGDLSAREEQQELVDQLEQLRPKYERAPEAPDGAAPTVEREDREPAAERPSGEFDPGRSVFAGTADGAAAETEDGLVFEPAAVEEVPPAVDAPLADDIPAPEPPVTATETAAPTEDRSPRDEFAAPDAPTSTTEEAPPVEAPVPEAASTEALDQEILDIFLEEATEVLERGEAALQQWRDDLEQLDSVRELQREIHTFKGGARMAGLTSIGDYAHEMEDLLERVADRAERPTLSTVQVLEEACDRLTGWVEEVRAGRVPDADRALTLLRSQIGGLGDVTPAADAPRTAPEAEVAGEEAPPPDAPVTVDRPVATTPAEATPVEAIPDRARTEAPGELDDPASGGTIKVAAELLDRLVNASGEVSIYRSRLEQQIGKLKANIADFDETIQRLSDQFRKMDIEIETQIRSNYPDMTAQDGASFDPLELDQFSALQQATRSLQESVADLLSLQEMAEENVRASEQLLTRQSRVSTELQEGLMKTRMVPFATIAPKLRAIVRRACREEGKQARLQVRMVGSSDELDRNVLEHITAPLEHMMRNAVAHGIEKPEVRRERDKPVEGDITITVESEATEFVIRIADDGGGIDLDAIRRRAIERGLLDEQADTSRQQLYAFMMDSGFSTSSSVTQLAGRGVGMDVVNSDIKQIGGSLEIDSEPGQGAQFTIRIPFTLAIMQAIGLEAGDARYLLPLSAVVGVSRVLPDDYRKLLEEEQPVYRFAGQEYPVLDIEPLLGERPTPLGKDNVSLLILRAGEQKAAIRVPQLLPHREVVIKPVGPQIGSVAGVLGGSISGDGEVMVILDPGPMIRRALLHGVRPLDEAVYAPPVSNQRLVLVVDDSITMRKVTSRVLESRDYEVITARDGVDALEQLQDRTPDIMLFDIEMPRMDGYELTERVRDDGRFRNTPIMMITSRAGQKHRDRAMQAGATAYLTKPYREDELLAEVERLLDEAVR